MVLALSLGRLPVLAQSICAPVDDGQIHLPPDYTTFPLPSLGVPTADPTYGCSYTRLTDGYETDQLTGSAFGKAVTHSYSSPSPFNSPGGDPSQMRILVSKGSPIGVYVVDRNGTRQTYPLPGEVFGWQEPLWSTLAPNLFYYHTTNQCPTCTNPPCPENQIVAYDISTGTKTTVATFPRCVTFAGGEGDIAPDGLHLPVEADGSYYRFNMNPDLVSGSLGPQLTGGSIADLGKMGVGVDYCDLTPVNNNLICRIGRNLPNPDNEQYNRFEVYNGATGGFVRRVSEFASHADRALDITGDEVLIVMKYDDPPNQPPTTGGCSGPGVEKLNLATSVRTCLLPLPYTSGGGPGGVHVSVNNVEGHPWALVSTFDSKVRGTAEYLLPVNPSCAYPSCSLPGCSSYTSDSRDWQCMWNKYYSELILVRLDGTQIHRLTHTRSRRDSDDPAVANCPAPGTDLRDEYWFSPRASLSRDGKSLVFDSNFAKNPFLDNNPCLNYEDVYLMDIHR